MKKSMHWRGAEICRCFHRAFRVQSLPWLPSFRRKFQTAAPSWAIRTQKLGDVGEGITECMLNMWFVEEGARVEEWDKLCELQSDKAAVEISANFTGVIKKLYAQADDMIKTGAPLVDIDDGLPGEDVEKEEQPASESLENQWKEENAAEGKQEHLATGELAAEKGQTQITQPVEAKVETKVETEKFRGGPFLATPAVRGLLKEHNITSQR